MNKYNPEIHHRRSIRLLGYDYTQAGLYFITLCVQNRECLFGHIENNEMILNDAGKMVVKWYHELENKFPDIQCHEMVVMPNHMHFIIENVASVGADLRVCPNTNLGESQSGELSDLGEHVGADLRVCPNTNLGESLLGELSDLGEHVGADLCVCPNTNLGESQLGEHVGADLCVCPVSESGESPSGEHTISGEHVGSPLHRVVQWFKTMTTNEYIRGVKNLVWPPFNGKLWQRNYYEHIIRNEKSYLEISQYIHHNPEKWFTDKLNQTTL
jgi:putative transposase